VGFEPTIPKFERSKTTYSKAKFKWKVFIKREIAML